MKKLLHIGVVLFFAVGCSTFSYHKNENVTPDGIKVEFGTKDGIHIGDKVNIYENKCTESGRGANRCKIVLIGTMTVQKVNEAFSFAKLDSDVKLKDGLVFKLAKHCEKNHDDCR